MRSTGKPSKKGCARPKSAEAQEKRKTSVLTKKTPSKVQSIADAVVLKDQDLYFLCNHAADVPTKAGHGLGLYYQDTRFLDGYTFRIDGQEAHPLVAANQGGFKGVFQLTNPELRIDPDKVIEAQHLGITISRLLRGEKRCLYDVVAIENYALEPIRVPLTLNFSADFKDVFAIRGLYDERPGRLHPPRWDSEQVLTFSYDGEDGVTRRVCVYFSRRPDHGQHTEARFSFEVAPGDREELLVAVQVFEYPTDEACPPHEQGFPDLEQVETWLHRSSDAWLKEHVAVKSDSLLLNRIIESSLRDLHTLRSELEGEMFFAAGVPWFTTLFGRDSIIATLETLAYNPQLAEGTLRLLAKLQGTHVDPYRDEEPGRILHEMRVGELANIEAVPHDPNYGTVDATPLFLILLARHAQWTGRLDLFRELREHVDRALLWIDKYGDSNDDGYIDYTSEVSGDTFVNMGWKDSGNAMVTDTGHTAEPPITLVEVQGYVYEAKRGIAELFERDGDAGRAAMLRREAEDLKKRFNRDFWLPDMHFLAMALQKDNQPLRVASSNAGQALWSGIVDADEVGAIERRLMAPDMFSGWGIRTLSADEKAYNPNSYHLGSVWPHDNALIANGLKRYGFDSAVRRIFSGLFEAATHFDQYRMPELFTGYRREDYGEPVRYPVACHPQAWAAGSIPYVLTTMLGLEADGFAKKLRVVRPMLPDFVSYLELHDLHVGDGRISLRFRCEGEAVTVVKLHGDVDLEVEEPT